MATDRDWQRLADRVRERRTDLDLTQEDVRAAGGPSTATLRLIEGALQDNYQQIILRRLEDALGWQRGSVRRVLDGDEPALASPEPVTSSGGITLPSFTVTGSAEPAAVTDDATAMETAVVTAALPRQERQVWAEMRDSLQLTPAGAELFADPSQAALWPDGAAPIKLTPEAKRVLDSTPPDVLFTARSDVLAASLAMYSWHERVQWAAAGRTLLRSPTSAARRAG